MKAFPFKLHPYSSNDETGMDLRDYFAAKAMQALITNGGAEEITELKLAGWAYLMADAMIKAREVK